jgi:protein-tyrosine phosphatase
MKKVLFVCLGNICRSPLAEEIFKDKIKKLGLEDKFLIDSCGTETFHNGEMADYRSRQVAIENGIRLNTVARCIVPNDFQKFDIIIAMDRLIYEEMKPYCPLVQLMDKVHMMREFDPTGKTTQRVPDPYYGTIEDFRKVYKMLDRCADGLVQYLTSQD